MNDQLQILQEVFWTDTLYIEKARIACTLSAIDVLESISRCRSDVVSKNILMPQKNTRITCSL
jgi:hypothetical protein